MAAVTGLLDELYEFVTARARERVAAAREVGNELRVRFATSDLRLIERLYADVDPAGPGTRDGGAVGDYLRERASTDRDHPGYRSEWEA